jgi:hypothetical protein
VCAAVRAQDVCANVAGAHGVNIVAQAQTGCARRVVKVYDAVPTAAALRVSLHVVVASPRIWAMPLAATPPPPACARQDLVTAWDDLADHLSHHGRCLGHGRCAAASQHM